MKAKTLLNYLQGSWSVKKSLGNIASGIGFADFALKPDEYLQYKENIKLTNVDSTWNARAEHSYKLIDNKLYLRLMESTEYHQIHFEDYGILSYYKCCEDSYETLYFINGLRSFSSVCIVEGPKKNHTITTEYTRMTDNERLMQIAKLAGHRVELDQES